MAPPPCRCCRPQSEQQGTAQLQQPADGLYSRRARFKNSGAISHAIIGIASSGKHARPRRPECAASYSPACHADCRLPTRTRPAHPGTIAAQNSRKASRPPPARAECKGARRTKAHFRLRRPRSSVHWPAEKKSGVGWKFLVLKSRFRSADYHALVIADSLRGVTAAAPRTR